LPDAGFGLYLHWPFCQAKCPYCDFNSHVVAKIDQRRWAKAYVAEIARVGAQTQDKVLSTVFFGGGTPSLMEPETVAEVMEAIRRTWRMTNDVEITLEANPTSVEAGRFAGYRDAGVNRVSLGVQALSDTELKALGRLHSVGEARAAFDIARTTFDRVSFDLIYARQNQTAEAWRAELTEALAMAGDHLSLYQLTIEDGTAFGQRYQAGKLPGLPTDDAGAEMYEITQDLCDGAGLNAYEVSNHARPGEESRHNLIYWKYGDYAGIGPGAHGRLTINGEKWATETHLAPTAWLLAVEKAGSGETLREALDAKAQATERLLMGLRIRDGVLLSDVSAICDALFMNEMNDLRDLGLVDVVDGRIMVTQNGRPVLNAVLRRLLGA
jgi:oxygen-independent coproporphyrinogen-3 oxidase